MIRQMQTLLREALTPRQRKVFALGTHRLRQVSCTRVGLREHYELVLVPRLKSDWNKVKRRRRLQRLARRRSR